MLPVKLRNRTKIALGLSLFTAAFFAPMGSLCQDSQLIRPGPLGRPLMVHDEGDHWAIPISVYSDDDLEMFVSENLTLAGTYFDGPAFKRDGTYATYLYSYYKNDHNCRAHMIPDGHSSDPEWLKICAEVRYNRRLILVDTRNKLVTVQQAYYMKGDGEYEPGMMSFPKQKIPLDKKVNAPLFLAVTRVTTLIQNEIKRNPGP